MQARPATSVVKDLIPAESYTVCTGVWRGVVAPTSATRPRSRGQRINEAAPNARGTEREDARAVLELLVEISSHFQALA